MKQKEIIECLVIKWKLANTSRKDALKNKEHTKEDNDKVARFYAGQMTAYEETIALILGKSWYDVFHTLSETGTI